jgi:hypothetical protein
MKSAVSLKDAVLLKDKNQNHGDQTGSASQLKNIFDQSLAILCDGANSVRVRRSSLPLHIDAFNLQKRALSDAANALAALWKVPSSPKLHNGAIQYSR